MELKEDPGKANEGPGDAKDDLEEKVKELKKPLELRTLYLAQCPVASHDVYGTFKPQAAFQVLEPSEVERMRVEELHHQWPKVSEPQLTQACALRKAEAVYTPDEEGLLSKLEEEGKPLEVVHTVELKKVRENLAKWFPNEKT